MLTYDDVPEKQGLDSLDLGRILLYQARPPNLRAIESCGINNRIYEVEFGRDVLILTLEVLSLDKDPLLSQGCSL